MLKLNAFAARTCCAGTQNRFDVNPASVAAVLVPLPLAMTGVLFARAETP